MRLAIIVAVLVGRCAIPAWADPTPDVIVVISDDSAFQVAAGVALAPAGMDVRIATDPAPSIAGIASTSRAIADREHASATVWLLFADRGSGTGATLIAYDRSVDRVLVRSLPYNAPLAEAQAAEAARVTGTMLRALRVVEQPRPKPPPPIEPPNIVVVQAPVPTRLGIDLDGGVRVRGPGTTAAPAGALGVIWRPDRLGVVLTGRLAPSAEVGMVDGRISDQSLALAARWPLVIAPRFAVIPTAGLAIHRIALDGTLDGVAIDNRRYDPAARIGVVGSYDLNPTIGLGIGVSADWLLRRQSYEVGPTEVLVVPVVQVSVGLVLIARIL